MCFIHFGCNQDDHVNRKKKYEAKYNDYNVASIKPSTEVKQMCIVSLILESIFCDSILSEEEMRMRKSYYQLLKINTFLTLEISAGIAHLFCHFSVFCIYLFLPLSIGQFTMDPTKSPCKAYTLSSRSFQLAGPIMALLAAIQAHLLFYQLGPTTLWLLPLPNCLLWCILYLVFM